MHWSLNSLVEVLCNQVWDVLVSDNIDKEFYRNYPLQDYEKG